MARDDGPLQLFARRLGELRAAKGMTVQRLADDALSSSSRVSEFLNGKAWPPRPTLVRLDQALDADGSLLALFDELRPTPPPPSGCRMDELEEPSDIDQRRRRITMSNVDEAQLSYLESRTAELIGDFEASVPVDLVPVVRQLRGHVDHLMDGRQHPPQRERLYVAAVHLDGLLASLSLDMGYPLRARAYAAEAFELSEQVTEPDVQAWARAAQSLIAWWSGDYHDALAFARDGLRRAPKGTQVVRLAVNGEARALARLGDRRGVDKAVERAFAALGEDEPDTADVSPSLALGRYCRTRTTGNAATAYLALGCGEKVNEYAGAALDGFDRAGLHGPQALTRLDLACAALLGAEPEPDRAETLAMDAMTVSANEQFASINKRAGEFLSRGRRWANRPGFRAVAEVVAQRTQPALSGTAQ